MPTAPSMRGSGSPAWINLVSRPGGFRAIASPFPPGIMLRRTPHIVQLAARAVPRVGGPMASPLAHLRVLDLCDLRGALAGRMLGDLGADVLKVEPPDGEPSRARPPFAGD